VPFSRSTAARNTKTPLEGELEDEMNIVMKMTAFQARNHVVKVELLSISGSGLARPLFGRGF
jgi:hypothetical protein